MRRAAAGAAGTSAGIPAVWLRRPTHFRLACRASCVRVVTGVVS